MPGRNGEEVQGRVEETGGLVYPEVKEIISDYDFVVWYFIPPQSRPKVSFVIDDKGYYVPDNRKEVQTKLQAIIDRMKAAQGKGVYYCAALLVGGFNEQVPFAVGNKKTALITMDIFLQQNKIKLEGNEEIIDNIDILRYKVNSETHDRDVEKFAGWLRDHSKPA